MTPRPRPIVILGFNRPAMLDQVCASLAVQEGIEMRGRSFVLVQDGAVSAQTGYRYATDDEISTNVAVFEKWFPDGDVYQSDHNIGIARNVMRAEYMAFSEYGNEALFFEDDMIVGRNYVAILEYMLDNAPESVGYVAAYGNPGKAARDPYRPTLSPMPLNWGYGLRIGPWERLLSWITPIHNLMTANDYALRDPATILAGYRDKAVATLMETQDMLRAVGCADLGIGRVNLDVCYARNIGSRGATMTPQRYDSLGIGKMQIETRPPIELPVMDEALIALMTENSRVEAARVRREHLEPRLRYLASH